MANWCTAEIHVKGRKMDVDEFINILDAQYNYHTMTFSHIPHFYRIFECDILDEFDNDAFKYSCILIECAWSVYSCLFDGPYTYYGDYKNDENHKNRHTNILEVSKKHNLEIEIYSEEPGMCFKEHYHIKNGELLIDEEFPFYEIYIDEYDNYEEFCKDYSQDACNSITEEVFNKAKKDDNFISVNGYENDDWVMDEDIPDYLCKTEMCKIVDK